MTATVQAPPDQTAQPGRSPAAAGANEQLRQLLAAVPERPTLADSIELAGQMNESAFVDPPWLLERRDAGYIQVTRLLYLIAEECTGENDLETIAQNVSEKSGRSVSADNVRQLIATQLLTKGLVSTADGRVLGPPAGGGRSALQINLRTKELPPRILDPLTGVLKRLYWPPILGLVLAVAVAAEVWLYALHGVGGSIHDALYKPGFMLVVLCIIVCSAGFHELGHAAALRYGGGQVRGMGAGMYMVYPAFYTDVSDNYRLSRWARVRTDLGGFYFNLILSLGLFGLYLLTNQEALLLVVTLINFEILHQLLPFVRLDGYWTLADLTGIPDFFSQMGGFVRSVIPGARLKGRKLPELKWWAKLVFGLYMLITIPLLAFLLFFMVKSLPRVIATTWDALGQQVQQFTQALGAGDVLMMLGAAGQALLLCLPVLGLSYTLYRLGRSAFTLLYRWSRPSPVRRVVGTLVGVGVVALLVLLWAPQLPFGLLGGRPGLAVSAVSYTPIGAGERLTFGDAVSDVIATPEPRPSPSATAEPLGVAAEPTPLPTDTSAYAYPTNTANTQMPTPVVASTPAAVQQPTVAPTPPRAVVPTPIRQAPAPAVSPVPRTPTTTATPTG